MASVQRILPESATALAWVTIAGALLLVTFAPDPSWGAIAIFVALALAARPGRGRPALLLAALATLFILLLDGLPPSVGTMAWICGYWLTAAMLQRGPVVRSRQQQATRPRSDADGVSFGFVSGDDAPAIPQGVAAHPSISPLTREMLDSAPGAFAVIDEAGILVSANRAFNDMFNGEITDHGSGASDLCSLLGDRLWKLIRERGLESQQTGTRRIDGTAELPDGTRRQLRVLVSAAPAAATPTDTSVPAGQSESGHAFLIQVLDVSDDKARQHALAQSEARFRSIVEQAEEATLVIDSDGRIRYANPAAEAMFRNPDSRLVGTVLADHLHQTSRSTVDAALRQADGNSNAGTTLPDIRLRGSGQVEIRIACGNTPRGGNAGTETANARSGTMLCVTCRPVVADKSAAAALRAGDSRFSTIFHSSPDAILILRRADGTTLDFNAGFSRLLGYDREEALGIALRDLGAFADDADRIRLAKLLEADDEVSDFEARLIAKNGEVLHTEISVRPLEIDGERCLLCVGRDITLRRRAEAALKESEAKFAGVFFNSPDGIAIICMENGRILEVNDAFLTSLAYQRDQLMRRRVQQLGLFADESDFTSIRELVRERTTVDNVTVAFRAATGEIFPAQVSASAIELNGRPSVVCVAKDNRKQLDTELMLKRSEERFRGAFENSPVGMLLAGPEGFVFQVNNFAVNLLAMTDSELIGSHLSKLVPAEERPDLKETMTRLLYQDQEVDRSERRMLCGNSMQLWTNFHIAVQRNEQNDPLYFIVQIADITEMRQSREQMERMAFYDTLTDLANRRLFGNRLEQAIEHTVRKGGRAALLALDLDQFKRVNDTLGHDAGDSLLREVGRRLNQCVRKEDTVARPGGDEFAVLLYDVAAPSDAGRVAEKILERLREPISIAGHQLVVTTSIGIVTIPEDSVEPTELTKNADLAMYRAKERGRNNYQYFAEDMNTQAVSRLRTENELHTALAENRFELFYQPKVRLSDRRIVGAECLIRWHHPTRGIVMPDQFIGIAEESGSIVELGNWIIGAACEALATLNAELGAKPQMAINISPRQFRDPNLINRVRRALRESGVDPSQLELEITETMLMVDTEAAATIIRGLHELGVRIAIDDFGTGYSSLNYLKRFPIHVIKVDRTFVMDIPDNQDDMEITSAVIAMAHGLNLEVVAEGIETSAQLAFLNKHHCEYGQGYYFSKPLPFAAMQRLLMRDLAAPAPPRQALP